MNPTLLEPLPLELDPASAVKRLRLGRTRDPEARVRVLIRRVLELAKPRGLYAVHPVGERGEDWVAVGAARLHSVVLARHTRGAEQVFPYLVTLGPRVEEEVSRTADLLEQYCLHEVANLALARARDALRARVGEAFGLPKLYSLAPGSLPDWPITEQRALFGLLGDVEGRLGVRLTESFLMIPRKSLSGLIFPSDRPFVSCRLCGSRDCPGRQAAYDPQAAAEDHD
ncbi:MAG: vitamin B12 dependent-methionine synthase activation domain-containing protein [Thermodesulfobacteriota bacterium]